MVMEDLRDAVKKGTWSVGRLAFFGGAYAALQVRVDKWPTPASAPHTLMLPPSGRKGVCASFHARAAFEKLTTMSIGWGCYHLIDFPKKSFLTFCVFCFHP